MHKLRFGLLFMFLLLFFIPSTPVGAASTVGNVAKYTLGDYKTDGHWLQGFALTQDSIYYYDHGRIKKGTNGVGVEHFNFKQMHRDLQKYNLHFPYVWDSFVLGQMEFHKDDLYISGFMLRDRVNELLLYDNKPLIGETYAMLFKIDQHGEYEMIHLDKVRSFSGYLPVSRYYDNATGKREDLPGIKEEDYFDDDITHFSGMTPLKFTFDNDKIVYTAYYMDDETKKERVDIIRVGDKTEILMSIALDPRREGYRHMLAYTKEDALVVVDDTGVHRKHLGNGSQRYIRLADEKTFTRISYQNDKIYYLNDKGFFWLDHQNGTYKPRTIILASDAHYHIEISYYVWLENKKMLYTNDYLRPKDFWIVYGHRDYKW